jgi:hypothetical protein
MWISIPKESRVAGYCSSLQKTFFSFFDFEEKVFKN